jgi:cytochrome c oxidase subunit IV
MSEHGHEHHISPLSLYMLIFGALMIGTAITVAIAFVDLGALNTPIALAIACFKATLVILFFMHVKYSHPLVWLSAAAGFFWLGIMFVFLFSDYYTRGWDDAPPIEFLKMSSGAF